MDEMIGFWALPILWEQGECWTCVCILVVVVEVEDLDKFNPLTTADFTCFFHQFEVEIDKVL